MTKLKIEDEVQVCKDCGKDITINVCASHKTNQEDCYYCHLMKVHIHEYTKEEDKPKKEKKK